MWTGRKLPLTLAFVVVVALAIGVSCKGFFVDPQLTSIAVGPATPTIQVSQTQQFSAVGTYDDGSHGHPPVTWSSDNKAVATVNASGLATGIGLGTANIKATSTQNPTISGSQPLTVTATCIQSIAVTPTNPTVNHGQNLQFTATATTCNGPIDITNVAVWSSSNTAVATISSTGLATTIAAGTTNITAASGSIVSPIQVLTVN